MKRAFIITFLLFVPLLANANECVVKTADGLVESLTSAMEKGSCKTDSAEYRKKYDDYRNNAIEFHVVRIKGSANFEVSLPCLQGHDSMPLILTAGAEAKVIISSDSICIEGAGGNVILDAIEFKTSRFEIKSNGNAILNSKIFGEVMISGNSNHIVSSEILESPSHGIQIKGDDNEIIKTEIKENEGHGVFISGRRTKIKESKISKNSKSGVFVDSCADETCTEIRTALITRTEFLQNGETAIAVEKFSLQPPQNLVSVSTGSEWKVTGNIINMQSPWRMVELFIKNGQFVADTDIFEEDTGEFVFSLSKEKYPSPVFTATFVDLESGNTSPFSEPLDTENQSDLDNDGISNDDEDYNHNGTVDFGETDPRNPDTDGDGLTDGEERLHLDRIKEMMDKGKIFSDLTKLDPVNADSDGDCLNDGLELGVVASPQGEAIQRRSAVDSMKEILQIPPEGGLSPYCKAILKQNNVISVSYGDADILTTTDPTNSDTDSDGFLDGEEDWNFNGKRDDGETDPNDPDSDGDSFIDGSEGDTNKNGVLDEGETDALLKDTDGDGLSDDAELLRFGSKPNACDSDGDGLPDGIEGGAINPNFDKPECSGLQTAGTNFSAIGNLSPTKTDSDGDGLSDGEEDANHNGWLDINETDPTTPDTDGDSASDGIEANLDADRDGFADISIVQLSNGKKCSPPKNTNDIDCDGIVNARDEDSDNDGCSDIDEGFKKDKDANGLPDIWELDQASCNGGSNSAGSALGSTGGSVGAEPSVNKTNEIVFETVDSEGGGACTLIETTGSNGSIALIIMAILPLFVFRYKTSNFF